jgi:hypothetical protein
MLSLNTLFVIGAGASAELHFPCGAEFTRLIAQKLNSENGYSLNDLRLHSALLMHVGRQTPDLPHIYSLSDYVQAGIRISRSMPLADSIDSYMDTHRSDECIQMCGKLAIVQCIAEAEASSIKKFNLSSDKFDLNSLANKWYGSFFKLLKRGASREERYSITRNVSVINFNYDRSLEHILVQAISLFYDTPETDAIEIVKTLPIVHPYGTVAPWHENEAHEPFGAIRSNPEEMLQLSERIQTYTDTSAHADQLRELVSKAEIIVFLGFGFIQENVDLLGPHPNTRYTRQIYGTAYSVSEPNKVVITASLGRFLRPNYVQPFNKPGVILVSEKCVELLNEYSMPISSGL